MPEIPKTFSKLQLPPINKQSQASVVEIVLLIVIAGLFYWFVASPKKAELAVLETKIAALKTEQSKVDSQKKDLQKLVNEMKENPDLVVKLDEGLPLNGKVFFLNLIVKKFADEAGVNLTNVFFSASSDAPIAGDKQIIADPFTVKRSTKKILGNFTVEGQVSQVQAFLLKLEQSGRIFNVSDIQYNADPQGLIHVSGSLNTYYFGQ